MSKSSELYENIGRYTETAYEVYYPDAEVTDDQQRLFFERCEELHSPVDLDTSILEWRDRGDVFLTDDEVVDLTNLTSADLYYIFGSRVYLDTDEPLNCPERQVRLSVYTLEESELGNVVMVSRSRGYEVTYDQAKNARLPHYRERDEIFDKALVKRLSEMVTRFASELPFEAPGFCREIGESSDVDIPDIIQQARKRMAFTQAKWAQAMMTLDMIEILKELGLTSTDDLNW